MTLPQSISGTDWFFTGSFQTSASDPESVLQDTLGHDNTLRLAVYDIVFDQGVTEAGEKFSRMFSDSFSLSFEGPDGGKPHRC